MRIPVLLKANTESGASLVGSVELLPTELGYFGRVWRTFRRYRDRADVVLQQCAWLGDLSDPADQADAGIAVHEVALQIEPGPHGVPVAVHHVPLADYEQANAMWRSVKVVEALALVEVEKKYASVRMEQWGCEVPNPNTTGA